MRAIGAMMAALAASAQPAAADWQYTQWGMVPAQVMAASGGVARNNADRNLDVPGFTAELVAPFEGASLTVTAVFLFDAAHKLEYVTLHPIDRVACPVIVKALESHYGEPKGTVEMGPATTMRWDDDAGDNLVVYSDLGGGDCTIQYSKLPLTRPDGKGL